MKKITTLLLSMCLPIICTYALEYNNSEENPIQSGSPTEALLDYLQAAANKDSDEVLEHTAKGRRFYLENKPNATEDFFESVQGLDFDSPILWVEIPGEDFIVVSVKVLKKGSDEHFQTRHRLTKIDGSWKVTT